MQIAPRSAARVAAFAAIGAGGMGVERGIGCCRIRAHGLVSGGPRRKQGRGRVLLQHSCELSAAVRATVLAW